MAIEIKKGTGVEVAELQRIDGAHDRLPRTSENITAISEGTKLLGALSDLRSSAYGRDFGAVPATAFGSAQSDALDVEDDPAQVVERPAAPRIAAYYSNDLGAQRTNVIARGSVASLQGEAESFAPSLN